MSMRKAVENVRRAAGAVFLGVVVSAAGCGGGGGVEPVVEPPAADTQGPAILNALAAPASLRFTGGQIAVAADVSDPAGVARVWAVVTKPDSSTETIDLGKTTASGYSITWVVPGNPVVGGSMLAYAVRIYARDALGNGGSVGPFAVNVEAVEAPPPLPVQ